MPFRNEAQRRALYKHNPALARKWQKNYKDGGYVCSDVPSFADGGYVNSTALNMKDGGVVDSFLSKSNPQVERTRYYNEYIKRRNADDEEALSMKFPEWYEKYQGQLDIDGKPVFNFTARELLEFVPVIGDILAAEEVYRELKKDPINWLVVGILTGGTIVGLIPGVGDVAAAAIKKGGRMLKEGSKEALDTIRQYDLEIDPNTLGTAGGNIKIVKKGGRPKVTRTITVDYPDGTSTELTGDSAAQAIADATGKPLKTVQNRLSEGKPIVGDDGTIYSEKGKVDNELIDTRESTYGQIDGYDGTFSDLMREHGIDPKSSEADAIRKRLARGQEWNGYKRSDVEDYDVRHDQLKEEQKAKGKATKAANMVKRIQNAGLDSNNPELVSEFTSVWNLPVKKGLSSLSSGSAESAIRVAREQASNDAYREYISRPKVKEKMDKYKLEYKDLMDRKPDFHSPNDPLKEQGMSFQFGDWELEASELAKAMNEVVNPALAAARQAGDSAAYREFQEQLGKKAAKDPQFTQWRKFFLKYAPEKINHLKTAQEQRQEIYRILMGSYIGNPG